MNSQFLIASCFVLKPIDCNNTISGGPLKLLLRVFQKLA